MDFLTRNTKSLLDDNLSNGHYISAKGLDVIVIGGGDTGADCIGTSLRHGCKSMTNFELLDRPPAERAANNPWPEWPRIYRVDYSHAEAKAKFGHDPREYNILTKEFVDDGRGHVKGIKTVARRLVEAGRKSAVQRSARQRKNLAGRPGAAGDRLPRPGTGRRRDARRRNAAAARQLGNVQSRARPVRHERAAGVFAAGDCRRGQSLVVWAINEGRGAARAIDAFLMGASTLPAPGITQGMLAVS